MMYLLWGLLNIGLYIYFIVLCYKAISLINENAGLFASVILAFGLFSFVCNTKNYQDENINIDPHRRKTWKFAPEDSFKNNKRFLNIELEKKLTLTYELGISYAKVEQRKGRIPISANSWTNGFTTGIQWKPSNIYVRLSDDSTRLEYEVYGTVNWDFLGSTIFYQAKEYKGSVKVE